MLLKPLATAAEIKKVDEYNIFKTAAGMLRGILLLCDLISLDKATCTLIGLEQATPPPPNHATGKETAN